MLLHNRALSNVTKKYSWKITKHKKIFIYLHMKKNKQYKQAFIRLVQQLASEMNYWFVIFITIEIFCVFFRTNSNAANLDTFVCKQKSWTIWFWLEPQKTLFKIMYIVPQNSKIWKNNTIFGTTPFNSLIEVNSFP